MFSNCDILVVLILLSKNIIMFILITRAKTKISKPKTKQLDSQSVTK